VKTGESLIVPLDDPKLAAALKRVLESDRIFVAHDVKLQFRRLAANGWPQPKNFTDTMIMSYVINPGLPSHSLAEGSPHVVPEALKLSKPVRVVQIGESAGGTVSLAAESVRTSGVEIYGALDCKNGWEYAAANRTTLSSMLGQ